MASKSINSKIVLRNDTAANWTSNNPKLLKGELGIETDTRKFKIGNGTSNWDSLEYASATAAVVQTANPTTTNYSYDIGTIWVNTTTDKAYVLLDNSANAAIWHQIVTPDELSDLGAGDMMKATYDTNNKEGYVDKAIIADSLTTGRTFSVSGDATGTSSAFTGADNVSIPVTLANSGVTSGTYTKVTVDAKGRVTAGASLAESDIPTLSKDKITGLGTAATVNTGTSSGNVPVLDSNGKLSTTILPALAISEVYTVNSQAAMLALTAQRGDVAIRTDLNKSFILSTDSPTTLADWKELLTPADSVSSVNSKTGVVVLTTSDIAEGTNLYYTDARVDSRFDTKFAAASSTSLSDTANIMYQSHTGTTYIIDGGTSASAGE